MKRKLLAMVCAVSMIASLGAATVYASDDVKATGDEKIALITMDSIDQHWITLNEGAQEEAKELEEEREERQQRIDEAKERRKEQEEILDEAAKSDRIDYKLRSNTDNYDYYKDAQEKVRLIMKRANMDIEELKGIEIDFNY